MELLQLYHGTSIYEFISTSVTPITIKLYRMIDLSILLLN